MDPDGCLPSEAEMMRRRSVRFGSSRGGLVSLYMDLLPEVAAKLSRMFDALGNPRVRNHQTGGGDPRGEEATAGSLTPVVRKPLRAACPPVVRKPLRAA